MRKIKGLIFIIIIISLAFLFSGCNKKTGCEIKKAKGFSMEGSNLSIEVDCTTEYMPLYEYIEVSPNAVYTVSKDIYGVSEIPSAVVSLELEENIYYINVVSGNGTNKKQYIVNIKIKHKPSYWIIDKEQVVMYKECVICRTKVNNLEYDGTYAYLGFFPQTIKNESVIITEQTNSLGYYLGLDGEYYAKLVAKPCEPNYVFSNEKEIVEGETYYFKVEPIKWRILEDESENYQLLSEYVLDCKQWGNLTSNYEQSDIRVWLNSIFYNQAFTEELRKIIQTTEVDNSTASTGYNRNPYACGNTNDKIYLLSYLDVTNTNYGFNSDTSRIAKTTDYAKAQGIYVDNGNSTSAWWLRSPLYNYPYYVRKVSISGGVGSLSCDDSRCGVRPTLTII